MNIQGDGQENLNRAVKLAQDITEMQMQPPSGSTGYYDSGAKEYHKELAGKKEALKEELEAFAYSNFGIYIGSYVTRWEGEGLFQVIDFSVNPDFKSVHLKTSPPLPRDPYQVLKPEDYDIFKFRPASPKDIFDHEINTAGNQLVELWRGDKPDRKVIENVNVLRRKIIGDRAAQLGFVIGSIVRERGSKMNEFMSIHSFEVDKSNEGNVLVAILYYENGTSVRKRIDDLIPVNPIEIPALHRFASICRELRNLKSELNSILEENYAGKRSVRKVVSAATLTATDLINDLVKEGTNLAHILAKSRGKGVGMGVFYKGIFREVVGVDFDPQKDSILLTLKSVVSLTVDMDETCTQSEHKNGINCYPRTFPDSSNPIERGDLVEYRKYEGVDQIVSTGFGIYGGTTYEFGQDLAIICQSVARFGSASRYESIANVPLKDLRVVEKNFKSKFNSNGTEPTERDTQIMGGTENDLRDPRSENSPESGARKEFRQVPDSSNDIEPGRSERGRDTIGDGEKGAGESPAELPVSPNEIQANGDDSTPGNPFEEALSHGLSEILESEYLKDGANEFSYAKTAFKVIVMKNRFIPFKGFLALTMFGRIWTRRDRIHGVTLTHEAIHLKQERELLYVGFWILYFLEWLFRSVQYFHFYKGYKNISFEREAYANEEDPENEYLSVRPRFAWINYLKN